MIVPRPAPVAPSDRIVAIDVLRGFAILGILVVNIQSFAMIDATLVNPAAFGDLSGANHIVWMLTHVLANQKFMTIFSMLFGAGVVLMTSRREAAGVSSATLHYRRMTILMFIGLAHELLLWHGDILVFYAWCGMVVYMFRKREPRFLMAAGLGMLAVVSVLGLISGGSMPHWPEGATQSFIESHDPPPAKIAEELAAYRGGWTAEITYRAPKALEWLTLVFLFWGFWRAGGLMLIGMALLKLDLFSGRQPAKIYATLIAVAAVAGIPMVVYGMNRMIESGWDARYTAFFGSQYNLWASLIVSLGWVAAVMLACRTRRLDFVTKPLAAVGRTALSNYIGQTIICTTIFYGHGFGMFGRLERIEQAVVVAGVWIFQLVASPLWLKYFRFGPLEWVWRSLTYRRAQPFRL